MAGQPRLGDSERREEIMLYAKKTFDDSDGAYGCQRVRAQLRWGIGRADEPIRADARPEPGSLAR